MNKTLRLGRYLWRYKLYAVIVFAGIVTSAYFRLLVPAFINVITKSAITDRDLGSVLFYSLAIIGVTAVSGVGQYFYTYYVQYAGSKAVFDIREDLFASIQEKSFTFFDKNEVGDLMARATGDVEAVRRFLSNSLGDLLFTAVLLSGVAFQLLALNRALLVPSLGLVPFVVLAGYLFDRRQSPNWKLIRERFAKLNSAMEENLSGLRVVRAFTRENFEIEKFDRINRSFYDANIEVARTRATYIPLLPLLLGINTALLLYLGGQGVMEGTITINELLEAYAILVIITPNVRFLGLTLSAALNAAWGLERIFATMDATADVVDSPGAVEVKDAKGEIVFDSTSFSYETGQALLKDVNITIPAGETIAIVGKTGSGKSTFVNLIPRFYDVTSGRISIDGKDVREIKLKSLRKLIGMVSQETFLFARTIRENIEFGVRGAKMDDVIECAKVADAHDFIMSFPKGYDTVVGERGVTLSGGQRQRIAIARALLTNPRILIFDDSTSNVDVETEREIQDAMEKMLAGRTTLLITQRLSTVRLADRIAVFDSGRLVELGTHAELLKQNGVYAQLFGAQFMERRQIVAGGAPS